MGRWTKKMDYGEGSASAAGFPAMPSWFHDNRDFGNIEGGLTKAGFNETDVNAIMGNNWFRFFKDNFTTIA